MSCLGYEVKAFLPRDEKNRLFTIKQQLRLSSPEVLHKFHHNEERSATQGPRSCTHNRKAHNKKQRSE